MYYSAIGLLAALVLLIVNRDILWSDKVYDKPAWNIYRKFLCAVLVYYVTDIIWGILEYKKLSSALFVDTTLYFAAMAAGISFWTQYTVTYLNQKSKFGRFLVYTGRGITALILGLTAVNIFTPVIFTVDSECVYTPLPVRYAILGCQILFLTIISLFALTTLIRQGHSGEASVPYRILASFGIIMAIFLFVQLWFPYLPLYSAAYMLGTCLLHAFVANDEKAEHRRQLEEAGKITELKDRFYSLLDNMPGMTFTKYAETGKYFACNQAFAEFANKTPAEIASGLTDHELFSAETAEHIINTDKIALSISKPYMYYEDTADSEGNPRQLQTTKVKYKDSNGRLCILGICQDITDLVTIRREQAMTKEAYEGAVKTGLMYTHIAHTLARDYTQMFYVNTDTEEFTEYRRNADSGDSGTLSEVRRGWHFFSDCKQELCEDVYPDDKEAFLSAVNRKKLMKALNDKDTFVLTYRRIVGECPVYFSMKISRMEDDENHIIVGFTDVDAEMREAMAKNEALLDALHSAEEANRSKNTFLSGMSHEIRTPINAIIGLDSLALKNRELNASTRDYLEKIGDSAHNLLSIINDILDMSRLESGREILNNGRFFLGDLLEQINAQIGSMCAKKGLEYDCHVSDRIDGAYIGDEKKLRSVLMNILTNAVKYTERNGSVTMTVEKTAEHEHRVSLQFLIKDTGIGIDEDYLPKLFDAFTTESAGSGSVNGGRGLGMAITKRIVDMMNGSVSVKSEKGAGTEFCVTLTLGKGDQKDAAFTGEIDTRALYILVVDDNTIEAEHAGSVLKEAGIRADICSSGQEALRKIEIQHARKKPYNIVLLDWIMPVMSGAETAAEILKLYAGESVVAAMTAYNWDDIRKEAHCAGVENYIEKPLLASNILENLGRIARQNHMAIFKGRKKARLDGRRILLAEDSELNAEILTDILDMDNIKVDHAENGEIAVWLFENSTEGIYSAILMDVRMPKMDGLEAARTIRAMDREDAKRIPIIALTANAFDEDVQLSLQAGMNAHLNKPVEADLLIRTLGELIYEAEQTMTAKL